MISVILYHSIVFWNGNWFTVEPPIIGSKYLGVLSQWLNSFHVYGFTLTSGYLFYYLKVEKGKYNNYKAFVVNKVNRLLIPYVFTAVIWVIPISLYYFKYNIADIFKRYVIATSPSQLWFLWMLFWIFVIFCPLTNLFKKSDLMGFCLVCLMYVIGLVGGKFVTNIFCIWTACKYLVFFWIGFKIRQGNLKVMSIPWYVWMLADVVIFTMQTVFFRDGILEIIIGLCLNVIGAIAAFVVLQQIALHIQWEKNGFFNILSHCTMPMYLFHQQLIYMSISAFNGVVNPYVNALINFGISFGLSFIMSNVFLRFKWTRLMIGGTFNGRNKTRRL